MVTLEIFIFLLPKYISSYYVHGISFSTFVLSAFLILMSKVCLNV